MQVSLTFTKNPGMKKPIFILLVLFSSFLLKSQEIIKPNFSVASHPMVVDNIRFTLNQMIVSLSIENKVSGGNFCVDQNTYVEDAYNKSRWMMTDSKNIPICPETYHFKLVGEKLNFHLYFPKPDFEIKYLNIIEECDNNCFSILGIILNPEMNKQINNAFKLFDDGSYESSKTTLLNTIDQFPDYPFGFLHLNLIQVLMVQEDLVKAREYYQLILNSNFRDKNFILQKLNKYKELKH
jgi:hypothetical protein